MSEKAPEQFRYQVVVGNRHGHLTRPVAETFDTAEAAEQAAIKALESHPDATEVFVCTVHSAWRKTFGLERAI